MGQTGFAGGIRSALFVALILGACQAAPPPSARPSVSSAATVAPVESAAATVAPAETANATVAPAESAAASLGPDESAAATVAPIESAAPSPGPDESVADFPAGMIVGEGEFLLADPSVGLADLTSHTGTLTISFKGTVGGAPKAWSTTSTLAATKEPRAAVRTVELTGDLGATEPAWEGQANGVAYSLAPDKTCLAVPITADTPGLEEPAAALSGVFGGAAGGSEVLGGVETNTFTFDQAALGFGGNVKAAGKVWMATSGELVVRYDLTIEAGPEYFGEGIDGTLTTHYELGDVNRMAGVKIPGGCPTGLVDAPRPDGITIVRDEPGVLTFTTRQSVANVAAFYRDAAAGAGWTAVGDAAVTKDVAIQAFESGVLRINVVARKEGAHTSVTILTGSP
jgi:hypothetical protein